MNEPLRVIQVGLGPIGMETARRAVARPDLDLVGAVDLREDLQGRPLGELLGTPAGGHVVGTVREALASFSPRVALVTTVSDLPLVAPQCVELLEAGVSVVSTCEEMLHPQRTCPEEVVRLDAAGRSGGAACLGVGINPGFVLDLLPAVLSAPVDRVRGVRAWRVVDAAQRRGPLQKKVGAGMSVGAFEERVAAGGFGHRGMEETLHLVCAAFGVDPAGSETFIEPVIAERAVKTEFVSVEPGQVAGIHQGARDASGRIDLDLKMYAGAEDPQDGVVIDGEPKVKVIVEGGYHGDVATCAIALNALPIVATATPGFRTLLDVPPLRAGSLVGE